MSTSATPPDASDDPNPTADDAPHGGVRRLLVAPQARGRTSVARVPDAWYIAATSAELGAKPLARTVLGLPLVLFRDARGGPAALLDRCPHRNVPLSAGRAARGELECAYHGWRFDGGGACLAVPSLCGEPGATGRRATAFPAVERDGFVWVYATPTTPDGEAPATEPYRFPRLNARGYTTARQVVEAEATLHAALENALDVPHTAFLHRGLFRAQSRGIEITARVRRTRDRVEAEYVGEPRPPGVVARLLSPTGGVVTHFDRFILPCVAEVEYALGDENHFIISSAMTPVTDYVTRIYAVASFKLRVPGALVRPILQPLAFRIFHQDAAMLRLQSENVRRFGGEQFAWTEIDVLGRHILRLLRAAERGEVLPDDAHTEEVRLVV